MYKAGHLLRRSSIRLKSLSGGHSQLQMVISQLREVRTTFKAFVAAQVTLSEDLVKWSSTIENDAIHSTFLSLHELTSLWTEAQKDLIDSLKQFRYNFDLILEGEKHVDQAKQILTSREEAEKNTRRELQKVYNKASCEDIQLLRERLNRYEKVKEMARLDVVDRVRENEAVRMIRVKEGVSRYGRSFAQLAHKAGIIFRAQQMLASEIPDVHDRAIHESKFRASATVRYVEEAKEQLRFFNTSMDGNASRRRNSSISFHDPPPPYSPSREKLNDLTPSPQEFSSPSGASAPRQSSESLVSPISGAFPTGGIYPVLTPTSDGATGHPSTQWRTPQQSVESDDEDRGRVNRSGDSGPEVKPERKRRFSLGPRRRRTKAVEMNRKSAPESASYGESSSSSSSFSSTPSSTPPSFASCSGSSLPGVVHPNFRPPPPYNPFCEWSEFPPKENRSGHAEN